MSGARVTRFVALLAATCGLVLSGSQLAQANAGPTSDGGATWVSAPALAPPTPAGALPSPYPVSLGYVGDIEFWAPNRGLLITAGSGIVPEGLYAYNGVDWHELSTVCGGSDGRIAWAGPDEFWTIADQRPGQVLPNSGPSALEDVSLCHFVNGQVVGSYALPLDEAASYQPMNAAACDSVTDCWFGGKLNGSGAFHLWWNGTTLTEVDSPENHQVAAMTVDGGQIYESVQLAHSDYGPSYTSATAQTAATTPVIHVIESADTEDPFIDLFPTDSSCIGFCSLLPEYTSATVAATPDPATLEGLALSSDSQAGASNPQLWAAAGPDSTSPASGTAVANSVVLFMQDGSWTQVVPNLVTLPGGDTPISNSQSGITPTPQLVAAEPNEDAAWIGVTAADGPDGQAHIDRIQLTGPQSASVTDQDVLGDQQGVGPRGAVSAVACPAAQDCWVATTEGWLYHLTNGTQYPQDTDANFDGVITYRPPDSGVPVVTLANASPDALPTNTPVVSSFGSPTTIRRHRKLKPVITHVGKALLSGLKLKLPITVSVRARVQLIARRGKVVVARSPVEILSPGHRFIEVVLNRQHWPTAMSLDATAIRRH